MVCRLGISADASFAQLLMTPAKRVRITECLQCLAYSLSLPAMRCFATRLHPGETSPKVVPGNGILIAALSQGDSEALSEIEVAFCRAQSTRALNENLF